MAKYIQVDSGVNLDNRELHINNINIADNISALINNNIPNPEVSLVYDSTTSRTKQHSEFDEHPIHSEIMSKFINRVIDFENEFKDREDYLVPLLKFIKSDIIDTNYNSDVVKEMFYNLSLDGFFDNVSSTFFTNKLNGIFEQL